MSTDTASLYSVTSTTPLTTAVASARRSSKPRTFFARMFKSDAAPIRAAQTPDEIFREIMSINASSGAPEVKALMYESKSDKRAVTTAAKKVTKTKAAPKSGQDIADEIMRLNAVHGHPSVQGYLAGMK